MTIYLIHCMKPDHFRDGVAGLNKPTVATLANTHMPVRHVKAEALTPSTTKTKARSGHQTVRRAI